ncbi:hypothetical protein SLEP1_g40808 [Rubroshorea leprosula]|uniref:Uncharacterized protein n=1 Tax=Rubroshorea leprosula TaxID=152421 RepID=A0AAV5L5G5_9ROSI|nr:hypothetical protein SLEP1_g40808 [Rubroshorea leprosula]
MVLKENKEKSKGQEKREEIEEEEEEDRQGAATNTKARREVLFDPIQLCRVLRKRVGFTELVSPWPEPPEEKKEENEERRGEKNEEVRFQT